VFSPYYFHARRRGPADPLEHCALNVAVHGPGVERWALTERRRRDVHVDSQSLSIGPSALTWNGDTLQFDIDEWTMPRPLRVRGRVRVHPVARSTHCELLDAAGRHRWRPLAPFARIEVDLVAPALRWQGSAYLDSNEGDEPLERAFSSWTWSRNNRRDGTTVFYDVERRDGTAHGVALRFDTHESAIACPAPPPAKLPRTRWRLERFARAAAGTTPRELERFVDAPFYARAMIATRLDGQAVDAVHETLSLDRFCNRWVQYMIPFRMPRRAM
jgi:carotenoid 1,2-hydratase